MMRGILLVILLVVFGCQKDGKDTVTVASPEGTLRVTVHLNEGAPVYFATFQGKPILSPSRLGLKLRNAPDLTGPFDLKAAETIEVNETWEPVWGQENRIQSQYVEQLLELQEQQAPFRPMNLRIRVFEDGLGFRYEIPQIDGMDSIYILDEITEFNFSEEAETWWNDGAYLFDTPEQLYNHTALSEVDSANTPMTMRRADGTHLSIHEANLTNYAGMTLKRSHDLNFSADLVPWPDGDKVKTSLPMVSPWRTVQISEDAAGLLDSRLILNLNEENQLSDVSWIQPMKYIGIWWGMHINKYSWTGGERHGATTENTKRYIDFAAANNIPGVLVEGWNVGWDRWGQPGALNLLTSQTDFDLPAVVEYAHSRGVQFIGHHETTADVQSYREQMEDAYKLYHRLGVHAIKSGYVGAIKPHGQFHYGQWMVQHYREAVELAAKYEIMLDVHEPVKATGISRTWPNMMTREGARGMEFNAWSEGNPPDHTTILPFTRLLAGPLDYTPGIFDLTMDEYKPDNAVHTTLAKQLALMVVLYSPLQMAADLMENYVGAPAFQFIRDLKTDWDETFIIQAEIGDELALARRAGDEWFVGAITDEHSRILNFAAGDLISEPHIAEVYADSAGAHWDLNPYPIHIGHYLVQPQDTLKAFMAPGGGVAIYMRRMGSDDSHYPPISELSKNQGAME